VPGRHEHQPTAWCGHAEVLVRRKPCAAAGMARPTAVSSCRERERRSSDRSSPTAMNTRLIVFFLFTGSPDDVSALSSQATRARIPPVIPDGQMDDSRSRRGSRRRSATSLRFSVIPFPPGSWAPYGRLTGPQDRSPTGLPRPARKSQHRGGRPLYAEDGGALPGLVGLPPGDCRSTATVPALRFQHPIVRGFESRGINEGSKRFARPLFPHL
jgi:hypothetical protein